MAAAGGRVAAESCRKRSARVLFLVGDALHGGRSRSTHEESAKAIYFSSLTLLTVAASSRVAAWQQSCEASAKALYLSSLALLTAAAVEVRTKHPQRRSNSRRWRSSRRPQAAALLLGSKVSMRPLRLLFRPLLSLSLPNQKPNKSVTHRQTNEQTPH